MTSTQIETQITVLKQKLSAIVPNNEGKYDRGYYAIKGMIKNLEIKLRKAYNNENLAR